MRKNCKKDSGANKIIAGLYLPEKTWNILDLHAQKLERSTNWLLNKIIDNWIKRNVPRRKELWKRRNNAQQRKV